MIFKRLSIIFILISFALFSCSDDDSSNIVNDDDSSNVTLEPEFSVEINGNTFNAEFKKAFLNNGVLSIQASNNDSDKTFLINLKNPSETTYTTGNSNENLIPKMSFQDSSNSLPAIANPTQTNAGSITVTEFDTTNNSVSGNFNFSGTSPFHLNTNEYTNGVFTDIPVFNTEPEIKSGGSLTFDINGENYTPSNFFVNRISFLPDVDNDAIHLIVPKSPFETFILQFPTDTPTGEFTPFSLTNYNIQATLEKPIQIGPSSNNGKLTILENDMDNNHITGTFEIVLDDDFAGSSSAEFTITNGQFDIFYRDF